MNDRTRSVTMPALSGSTAVLAVQVALSTAVAGLAMGLLGASVAGSTENVTAGVVVRGLLTLTLVALICRALGARGQRARLPGAELVVVIGAVVGFVLDPLSLVGRSALTQLVADPGALTVIGDLVLWTVAAGLGARWGTSQVGTTAPATTPYG